MKLDDGIPVDYTKTAPEVFLEAVKAQYERHICRTGEQEPYTRVLWTLAKNMSLSTTGQGSLGLYRFLAQLFRRPAEPVRDMEFDLESSRLDRAAETPGQYEAGHQQLPGKQLVKAWSIETEDERWTYSCVTNT